MPPRSWLRFRVPLGFLFAAWYVMVARPSSVAVLGICLVFVLAGCLLRSWAAGYLLKGKRVAVGGPYAYIRNPLYMGSFAIGIGFCAALWQSPMPWGVWILWAAFLIGFGIVYRAKSLAEEKELSENLGDTYLAYARQVPAFLPTRGHVDGLGEQRFSRELFRRNREYQCWIGSLALLTFLTVKFIHAAY